MNDPDLVFCVSFTKKNYEGISEVDRQVICRYIFKLGKYC